MDKPVDLMKMLEARERRSFVRHHFFSTCADQVLIQFTVNIPGERKNGSMVRSIFREGLWTLFHTLPEAFMLSHTDDRKITGPEGFFSLQGNGWEIKRKLSRIEECHPLGRLWDMDVFTGSDSSVSRSEVGFEERICLICGNPAHECARSRSHSIESILLKIRDIYQTFSVSSTPDAVL